MDLALYNTLSRTKEVFKPLVPRQVSLYTCGPTVYYYAHIGNLRAYVFADVLRRTLEYHGFAIKQIINVTDIGHLTGDVDEGEDKMSLALKREGKPLTLEAMRELANFYFAAFKQDLGKLNIQEPEHFPFASDYIAEDIALVEELEKRGYTYTTSDGIYFDTSKFAAYDELRGGGSPNQDQSRIGMNPEKKNHQDFAVWKFSDGLGYEAPFGTGFPGWHLECSAMAMKYLGQTVDLHTGGIDHIPVHHTNERAQSEAATGRPFVRYWLHSGFVTLHEAKMAKSEGAIITLAELEKQGVSPLAYRYWLLTAHYRTTISFNWEAVKAAQQALNKLYAWWQSTGNSEPGTSPTSPVLSDYRSKFEAAMADDLNTPQALAIVWELIKYAEVSASAKRELILRFDKILGLGFDGLAAIEIPDSVRALVNEREAARQKSDYTQADVLRDQIHSLGFTVNDTPDGPIIWPKIGLLSLPQST